LSAHETVTEIRIGQMAIAWKGSDLFQNMKPRAHAQVKSKADLRRELRPNHNSISILCKDAGGSYHANSHVEIPVVSKQIQKQITNKIFDYQGQNEPIGDSTENLYAKSR